MSEQGDIYALLVGIDDYECEAVRRLQFAVADVMAFQQLLVERMGLNPANSVVLSHPANVSARTPRRANLLRELDRFSAAPMGPDDTFVLYFAGHGFARDDISYLLTVDSDPGSSILLKETAISLETVKSFIRGIRAGQQLLILDACRNEPMALTRDAGSTFFDAAMARDIAAVIHGKDSDQEKPGQGAHARAILSACWQGQVSYEYPLGRQSWFCHNLLETLRAHAQDEIEINTLAELVRQRMVTNAWRDLPQAKSQEPYLVLEGRSLRLRIAPCAPASMETSIEQDFAAVACQTPDSAKAYLKDVVKERLPIWQKLAAGGDPAAQYLVGECHRYGIGLAEDKPEAAAWYRKAAEQGNASAQYSLGMRYRNGEGVKRNYAEAIKWLREAAEQGLAGPQSWLGVMYNEGQGVERNDTEALNWYRKAAEQGDARAQYNLGAMYRNGEGVERNHAEAVRWLREAADQGLPEAQNSLGRRYDEGEGVECNDAEAVKWYRKAAEKGHASAQNNLGTMYRNGEGVEQNDAEAVKWYRKAAEQGHASAQYSLGMRYRNGEGVKRNYAEAIKWLREAAEQGLAGPQSWLGVMYNEGQGVERNDAEAVNWYRKAAEQGDARAQYNLGAMYRNGEGVERNHTEAVRWFRKAADQGLPEAQCYLAIMYRNGEGVERNYAEARKWFQKAAEQGHEVAKKKLNELSNDDNRTQTAKPTTISFKCPGCEKKLSVKAEIAGKKTKCPACGAALLIPTASQPLPGAEGSRPAPPRKSAAADAKQCPGCGFSYAWNGKECGHCHYPATTSSQRKQPTALLEEGSSPDKAVAVRSVEDEYTWLRRHRTGFRSENQTVGNIEGTHFDVHTLRSDSGEKQTVYFDISSFFPPALADTGSGESQNPADNIRKHLARHNIAAMIEESRNAPDPDGDVQEDERKYLKALRAGKEGEFLSAHYEERLARWKDSATKGDPAAQNLYAECLYAGMGVAEDEDQAIRWFRKAAEKGYVPAELNLALIYTSKPVEQSNDSEIVKWLRSAAEYGFSVAENNLGVRYYEGRGLEQSHTEAAKWFHKAAIQGYAAAQNNLGVMYRDGQGVKQDYKKAVMWFRAAAEKGHADAQTNLGVLYRNGQGVEADNAEALKWYRKAAEQGNALGQNNLGFMYLEGLGVECNVATALKWFREAADQGLPIAENNLGVTYRDGQGVETDDSQAVQWFRKAADKGSIEAFHNLGMMYETGRGVEQNFAEAIAWYRRAAEEGYTLGQNSLGTMYSEGKGVKPNDFEAIKWFRRAAEQGDAWGQNNLGLMYRQGRGVERNEAEAIKWFRKAAEQGNETATNALKELGD